MTVPSITMSGRCDGVGREERLLLGRESRRSLSRTLDFLSIIDQFDLMFRRV